MSSVLLLSLALAVAQPVEYKRERGTGTMTISTASNGVKEFRISTIGVGLPREEYEAYASTAKATFHNLKLCGK